MMFQKHNIMIVKSLLNNLYSISQPAVMTMAPTVFPVSMTSQPSK